MGPTLSQKGEADLSAVETIHKIRDLWISKKVIQICGNNRYS